MLGVTPYITFEGNCEDAINFYKENLNGEVLYMERYEGSPMASEGAGDKILHCTLKIGDSHVMACDNMHGGQPAATGSNISLAIGGSDVAAAESMFNKMADGGSVTMPMQETFWAERFGMLTDKFGVNWMFNCDKPRDESKEAKA
ncbi:MAG: VOC family protein [Pyrinomonadaceae bacterium]